jgi:hypothetical protein
MKKVEETVEIPFRRVLRVWWFICLWQGLVGSVIGYVTGVMIGGLIGGIVASLGYSVDQFKPYEIFLVFVLSIPIIIWWGIFVTKRMFRVSFGRFKIQIVEVCHE